MFVFKLLLLGIVSALSAHGENAIGGEGFQQQIDTAFIAIMRTQTGKAVCQQILGSEASAIEFHLGVSPAAAQTIAQRCSQGQSANAWIYPTSYQDIRKLTLKTHQARRYTLLRADTFFPIESWTDPFTNTTTLLSGYSGLTPAHLVQLLAHEMAVYFDSKADPAHPDADNLPPLHNLKFENKSLMNPLIAASNPLTAHTLTYLRALKVEYSIVQELVGDHTIDPPADFYDPYLSSLISDQCKEACLEQLIRNMHQEYLPIALPLLAFAPHYRAEVPQEIARLNPEWTRDHGDLLQQVLNRDPVEFLKSHCSSSDTLDDMQQVFFSDERLHPAFIAATTFLRDDLWSIEWPALTTTRVGNQTFLEFMTVPLLSGYNILLSSGPRVRVRTGNIE